MATIYDLARSLDLDPSTVSRALRDGQGLAPGTVAAVRAEARRQGYRPRERRSGAPKTVAILCPEVESSFYARIETALSARLRNAGYACILLLTGYDRDREAEFLRTLPERGVSGILCLTESRDLGPELEFCIREREVPAVQIGMSVPTGNYDNVRVDEEEGIRAALDHLTGLGHRRIAFLGGRFCQARLGFFRTAAARAGILENCTVLTADDVGFSCGYALAGEMLALPADATAVVAEYDGMALGVIRRLGEAGLSVPGDVSVVGFDDAAYCAFLSPALTTVRSHTESMCEIASEMLLRKLRDPSCQTVRNILIRPELIVRESTGAAR